MDHNRLQGAQCPRIDRSLEAVVHMVLRASEAPRTTPQEPHRITCDIGWLKLVCYWDQRSQKKLENQSFQPPTRIPRVTYHTTYQNKSKQQAMPF